MKLTALSLAAFAAAAFTLTTAPGASAGATGWDACPQGEFCLFENVDGAGDSSEFGLSRKFSGIDGDGEFGSEGQSANMSESVLS